MERRVTLLRAFCKRRGIEEHELGLLSITTPKKQNIYREEQENNIFVNINSRNIVY